MIKDKVELSAEFKSHTARAITSIIIFFIVYLLIFILALALTVLSVYGGLMLVISFPRLITIALGAGMASLGFLVLFFLLKFIFKTNKPDQSNLFEITKKDEPELFEMIQQIISEVGTPFPKKIYVSAEVNASVFYDSSFWSMMFPIKKNLLIGLGLVNSIYKEEFKAILSHEFGHFSQKTMKVGSYVYNVNQVIFNMLYDNDSYNNMIQKWANASGYFAIFVVIAMKIVEGIQWVLRMMYEFINKNYMGLSREMEFHADEIAANVTGYEPLKNSLLRMNLIDHSFNSVLAFYEGKISENIKSKNVFKEQSYVLDFIAEEDNLPLINGLPNVSLEELNKFNKSKLIIKDQWASHPSTEDRIKRLELSNLKNEYNEKSSANGLFQNIINLQEKLTNKLFAEVKYENTPMAYSLENFKEDYAQNFLDNSFSKSFNGYYDDKNTIPFELNELTIKETTPPFEGLFNDQIVNQIYEAIALQNDIEVIKQISDKKLKIKTFDYDGKKYKQKGSSSLLAQLQEEFNLINQGIKENDISIYQFFKNLERTKNKPSKIDELYKNFFGFDKMYDSKIKVYTELSNKLQFVNYTTPYEQIKSNFNEARALEVELKKHIKQLIEDDRYDSEITKEMKENFESYLSKYWQYFGNEAYFDQNLEILFTALNNYAYLLSQGYFLQKKEILDYKVSLLDKSPLQHSV